MAAWEYSALDAAGRKRKGVLEGDSARQIRSRLRERGWVPVAVSAVHGGPATRHGRPVPELFSPRLSIVDQALVTRQLSTLVAAGLPLEESLRVVAEQSPSKRTKALMFSVRSRILEGYSLARSLGFYPRAFNEQYRATIGAGEQSGRLSQVLERLAGHVENQEVTRRKIRLAAVYPVILLLVAVAIILFLLNSIVPRIMEVYTSSDQNLPGITRGLLAVTDWLGTWGLVAGVASIAVFLLAGLALRDRRRKARFQQMLLRLPLLGRFLRGFASARFSGTVALLTRSSVPLVEAMTIASSVVPVLPIRSALEKAVQDVRDGGALSTALANTGYFTPMVVHMVASGEASGRLDELLERAARQEDDRLRELIDVGLSLLEPLLLVTMGIIVLLIVTAVVLPLTQMSTMI